MSNRQTKPLSHLSCVFFSEWIMVYKDDHSMTMIGFVDWLSLFQAFSFLFRLSGGAFCIYRVYFGVPFSWGTISKTIIKISIASGFHQIMQLDQPTNPTAPSSANRIHFFLLPQCVSVQVCIESSKVSLKLGICRLQILISSLVFICFQIKQDKRKGEQPFLPFSIYLTIPTKMHIFPRLRSIERI